MKRGTTVIVPTAARTRLLGLQGAETMGNGDRRNIRDITIEAVPMYNIPTDESPVHHATGRSQQLIGKNRRLMRISDNSGHQGGITAR